MKRETQEALRSGHVIPIRIDDVAVPDELRDFHCCDLIGWDGTANSEPLKQLHRDIKIVIAAVPRQHAPSTNVPIEFISPPSQLFGRLLLIGLFAVPAIVVYLTIYMVSGPPPDDSLSLILPVKPAVIFDADTAELLPIYLALPERVCLPHICPQPDAWHQMLTDGRLSEARQFLEAKGNKSPYEMTNLARMYDLGIGGPPDKQIAAKLLEQAASSGSKSAKFDLGVMVTFGQGVPSDVERGSTLINDALLNGFIPDKASQIFKEGCCDVGFRSFTEIQKRIELLARNGNPSARLFNVITLISGISTVPCLLADCIARAREIAGTLRATGQTQWADVADRAISLKTHTSINSALGTGSPSGQPRPSEKDPLQPAEERPLSRLLEAVKWLPRLLEGFKWLH